jgi:hypothetical protein
VTFIFIALVVVIVVVSAAQLMGKGPAVRWFPRSMRGRVNRAYRDHGWPEPYDADGNKIPRRQRD